jgi:hypothetical protein
MKSALASDPTVQKTAATSMAGAAWIGVVQSS